jgi:hypothetical protein
MPTRINESNTSVHASFLDALTKNSDSLALSQLWVCGIDQKKLSEISDTISTWLPEYEEGWKNSGNPTFSRTENPANWSNVGTGSNAVFLWARGISFVGDGINSSRVGVGQSGAIKGLIVDGRTDFNAVNITFLESNVSFVDGMLRPWSVLAGYKSLKDISLRCDIEFFALEKWKLNEPLKVRKSLLLRNAVPVSIDSEELNYSGDKLIERQIQFVFDRYEMKIDNSTNETTINEPKPIPKKDYLDGNNPIPPEPKPISPTSYQLTYDPVKLSTLEELKKLLSKVSSVNARVRGVADTVSSAVAGGLNAVGLNNQANKVSNANQRFQNNVTGAVSSVLSTGGRAINGTSRATNAVISAPSQLAGNSGALNANQVSTQIVNSAKPAPTP